MGRFLRTLLLLVFITGIGVCAWRVFDMYSEYRQGQKLYSGMQQYVTMPAAPAAEAEMQAENTLAGAEQMTAEDGIKFPKVEFESLRHVCPGIVGWVCIQGTNISYPIVQGEDNRYYASTMIDGTHNDAGSIFMDFRNSPDFSDRHTVIYGHNMNDGTMFHDILEYKQQEYFEQHPVGLIMTPEKNYYFEIVSAYVASLAEPSWQLEFVDEADERNWILESMARSEFICDIQPQPGERYITLSTCSYEFEEARFVLVGILHEG